MRRPLIAALAAAAAFALCSATPARAAWIPDGTPLWPGHATSSYPYASPDGAGGFFVSFLAPSETTFFRFDAGGLPVPGWPRMRPAGLPPYGTTPLAPDGAGGAYFAATPTPLQVPPDTDVRVFHLLPDGETDPAFGPDGVLLCLGPDSKFAAIGPDGEGGAIVTWSRYSSGGLPRELYGSRVGASGLISPGWPPNGTLITSVSDPEFLAIGPPVPDGAGGFFQRVERVTFVFPGNEVRTQRLLHYDGIGQVVSGWPDGGYVPPGLGTSAFFSFTPDGGGGAFVSWNAGTSARILHLASSGSAWPGWPGGGLEPCPMPEEGLPCYASGMLADGEGGVWLALQRQLSQAGPLALTLHRLDAGGGLPPGWGQDGTLLPPSTAMGLEVGMAHGPGGACLLLYGEYADDGALGFHVMDLHAARVEPGGALFTQGAWSAGELVVCAAPGGRYDSQLLDAPGGAAFAVWRDSRGGLSGAPNLPRSLFAMRIHPDGGSSVGVPAASLADRPLRVVPNPARGRAEVRFELGERASVEIAVFDVAGRRVRLLASGTREAGAQGVSWDGRDAEGRIARPGVYRVRARIGTRLLEARLVRLE